MSGIPFRQKDTMTATVRGVLFQTKDKRGEKEGGESSGSGPKISVELCHRKV